MNVFYHCISISKPVLRK